MSPPRNQRGMYTAEVVVAFMLVAVVFAAVTTLVGRVTDVIRVAADRDGAQQVAQATLEEAKAYGCGLARGDEDQASLSRTLDRCWGGLGDSQYTRSVAGTAFTATLHTAWRQVGAGSGACADPNASQDRPKTVLAEADGLVRVVVVRWMTHGRPQWIEANDYEAVPPDAVPYRDTSKGAIELHGAVGSIASISIGSPAVTRVLDASGCALFPFLRAGSVSWAVGSVSGTARVVAEAITSEPSGAVVA